MTDNSTGRFLQVSNIRYSFDPSKSVGHRIQSVQLGDEALDLKREYKVVTRYYMVQGGGM